METARYADDKNNILASRGVEWKLKEQKIIMIKGWETYLAYYIPRSVDCSIFLWNYVFLGSFFIARLSSYIVPTIGLPHE